MDLFFILFFHLLSIAAGTRPSARVLIGAMGMMLNLEAIFAMCWVGFMVAVSIKVREGGWEGGGCGLHQGEGW